MRHRIVDYSRMLGAGIGSFLPLFVVYLYINLALRDFVDPPLDGPMLYSALPFLSKGFDWLAAQDMPVHFAIMGGAAALCALIASRHGRYIFDTTAGTLSFPASAMSARNYSPLPKLVGMTFLNHLRMKTIRLQDIDEVTSLDDVTETLDSSRNEDSADVTEASDSSRNAYHTGVRRDRRRTYALSIRGSMGSAYLQFGSRKTRYQAAELFRQVGKEIIVLEHAHTDSDSQNVRTVKMRHSVVDSSKRLSNGTRSFIFLCMGAVGLTKAYTYLAANQLPFLRTELSDWLAQQELLAVVLSEHSIPVLVVIAVLSVFIAARSGRYIVDTTTGTFSFSRYLRMKTIRLQDIDDITCKDYISESRSTNSRRRSTSVWHALEFTHGMDFEALKFSSREKRLQLADLFRQAGKKITVVQGLHEV